MATLNQRIAKFYDESSPLWLRVWGEHMHHGYYGANGAEEKDHQQAQLDLVDEVLGFARPGTPKRILDAGCGVGGSARLLAERYQAEVVGLTLSPVQAARGNAYNDTAGLGERVTLAAHDMMTYEDAEGFDFIWSLESAEHLPDKAGLLAKFYDLLRPGGTLSLVTWCHRETPPALTSKEEALLDDICRLYHLPPWCSIGDYERLAQAQGFEQLESADWSAAVAPFWGAVIRSALSWSSLFGLVKAGPQALKGAWAMRYMQAGFRQHLVRFGVLRMTKPLDA